MLKRLYRHYFHHTETSLFASNYREMFTWRAHFELLVVILRLDVGNVQKRLALQSILSCLDPVRVSDICWKAVPLCRAWWTALRITNPIDSFPQGLDWKAPGKLTTSLHANVAITLWWYRYALRTEPAAAAQVCCNAAIHSLQFLLMTKEDYFTHCSPVGCPWISY